MLAMLLDGHDDGRSKSFFCLATALLPLEALEEAMNEISKENGAARPDPASKKDRARRARDVLGWIAAREGVVLKLRKAGNPTGR